jgi:hypothetical protein
MLSQLSLMSLAATALVLIGIGLALRALVLLVPDREPSGETLPSSLGRARPFGAHIKKDSQGGSR